MVIYSMQNVLYAGTIACASFVYKLWSFQRKGIEIKSAGSGDRGLKREKSVVCEETRQIKCGGLDNSFHAIHTHTFQLPYPARCQ